MSTSPGPTTCHANSVPIVEIPFTCPRPFVFQCVNSALYSSSSHTSSTGASIPAECFLLWETFRFTTLCSTSACGLLESRTFVLPDFLTRATATSRHSCNSTLFYSWCGLYLFKVPKTGLHPRIEWLLAQEAGFSAHRPIRFKRICPQSLLVKEAYGHMVGPLLPCSWHCPKMFEITNEKHKKQIWK